jgi:hypothetical protein
MSLGGSSRYEFRHAEVSKIKNIQNKKYQLTHPDVTAYWSFSIGENSASDAVCRHSVAVTAPARTWNESWCP